MTFISSKSNQIIKYATCIKEKKFSREYGECLAESPKLIADLLAHDVPVSTILIDTDKVTKFDKILSRFSGKVYHISSEISAYLSDSVTSSGIFGFVQVPRHPGDVMGDRVLVLDNLQDPSNLGAILRSALAFNFKDVLLINCVYPYSAKVIRSSMGYVFNLRLQEIDLNHLTSMVKENRLHLVCADMDGVDIASYCPLEGKLGLVIGNEGQGVSDVVSKLCAHTVSIPMSNDVESLNASVSASILMFYLNKQGE